MTSNSLNSGTILKYSGYLRTLPFFFKYIVYIYLMKELIGFLKIMLSELIIHMHKKLKSYYQTLVVCKITWSLLMLIIIYHHLIN